MIQAKDGIGNELNIGDYISVASKSGNSEVQVIGKIIDILDDHLNLHPDKIRIKYSGITIWSGYVNKNPKIQSTANLHRIVKLHPDMISKEIKNML